jgi:hypothetical protein
MPSLDELTSPEYAAQLASLTDATGLPGQAKQQAFLTPEAAGGGGQDIRAMLLRMTPEQRQAMFEAFGSENKALEGQLGEAEAMGQPVSAGHTTGIGAALGGLGDIFRAGGSHARQSELHAKQQALFDRQRADAAARAQAGLMGGAGGVAGGDGQAMAAALRKQYPYVMAPEE